MSLSIASVVQSAANPALGGVAAAVMSKSLQQTKEQGQEAVDLIQSAAKPADDGRVLSVYA
jgi:hypothetical protein